MSKIESYFKKFHPHLYWFHKRQQSIENLRSTVGCLMWIAVPLVIMLFIIVIEVLLGK